MHLQPKPCVWANIVSDDDTGSRRSAIGHVHQIGVGFVFRVDRRGGRTAGRHLGGRCRCDERPPVMAAQQACRRFSMGCIGRRHPDKQYPRENILDGFGESGHRAVWRRVSGSGSPGSKVLEALNALLDGHLAMLLDTWRLRICACDSVAMQLVTD